ncbi:CdaR family transcriptional regulator [Bacillus sp. EB600]|uniref:PucR family transcriptional regulator n=1 Tax=Bacillus sp. EB600 TaxID=2806345 RepID=UPI00210B5735|nr:helix-turn-helix domain-containing protein [Bacillus sp. EB600]MCQ6278533.1 PucR family transcriptional regulator [Bacillus sp. EB600]
MNTKLNNPFKLSFESLEEFADAIRQALQCPITIEDANHRLLAYSFHDEKTDQARIATIISRRVPEKVINQLWKEGVIPALLSTTEPIRVKCMNEIGLGNRVAISIWKQKEVIGFIWALEVDKDLDEDQMDLLKKAAEAATNELLQLQVRNRKKEDHFQEFFWQLLTGHLTEHEEIIKHFHTYKITPSPSFAVIAFQFQQNITRKLEQQISYLLKTSQQLKIMLYTFDSCQLILLVSPPASDNPVKELDHFIDTFKGYLRDRYKITEVQPSVSNLYEDYQKMKQAYQESLTVLATKEKYPFNTQNIHYYQNLGIYQLFDIILEKHRNEGYENQALRKLHLYDQRHNSNLFETLEVFLDKDTNVTEAAKELVVHPNTLTYRLKRITEISEIDFKDPNQKMMLYIDVKLEKYLER